jgi:hypothetical protein
MTILTLDEAREAQGLPPLPKRRTITVVYYEPWFLGWCRWEISTELHYDDVPDQPHHRSTLASGRWKWRRRHARYVEATVEAHVCFCGPVIEQG